jgi:hypothetical protein
LHQRREGEAVLNLAGVDPEAWFSHRSDEAGRKLWAKELECLLKLRAVGGSHVEVEHLATDRAGDAERA